MTTSCDVAKRAAAPPKTASRVLNRDAPVSQKTKEVFAAAMEALGCVPFHAARSIKSSKSGVIGLITGAISNTGLPALLIVEGAQAVIEKSQKRF